ncbi:MAG: NADP-dependent isocitrate dehydrogenase [Oligoflexales bacterium]|nr:NADP-dependent isocitrate dehydrogenase [Oligoflexales bacterium]
MSQKITVAYGDGIGPEIMEACLKIFDAAGAGLELDEIKIGEKVYLDGNTSGIADSDWAKLTENKIFYKAPITTPQGSGYKSLNVTVRKTLGLYANVRPVRSLNPYVSTKHPKMDVIIVRENEEDLYAGIEHRQTDEVMQCLKLISRPGTEKIVRFAFEYARNAGRKKITCMTKDNIMKLTDGLFHKVFDEVAREYSDIESEHWIIDIGAAKFADTPEAFDTIVVPNLYGDVMSDISAQIAGSVGLAGSANIGTECAMFEAIHGSAPRRAGQNVANPSGLLLGGIQMLNYMGLNEVAEKVENAWLSTIEDGVHTYDIFAGEHSKQKVSTSDFAKAVIDRLGQKPQKLQEANYPTESRKISVTVKPRPQQKKVLEGVDVFLHCNDRNADKLGNELTAQTETSPLKLSMITNRGVKVYPNGHPLTFCTDHWRCRFKAKQEGSATAKDIVSLLEMIEKAGFDFIKTENLYTFDGELGYSLGQGQ